MMGDDDDDDDYGESDDYPVTQEHSCRVSGTIENASDETYPVAPGARKGQ
jgi:hypothetical protein